MSTGPEQPPGRVELRPHTFDGIQEFDQRLPNWWLLTLYGSIVFSVVFWFAHYEARVIPDDGARVTRELQRIDAVRLAALVDMVNDENLWKMAQNPEFAAAGALTFKNVCQSCHGASLRGRDEAPNYIGANLTDTRWLNGGRPVQIFNTVSKGFRAMPPRGGQQISDKAVVEVVAFLLSHHRPGEPVEVDPALNPPPPQ